MNELQINHLDWNKNDGLLPAIIQDAQTLEVLMQGYMNKEALSQTLQSGKITFFSRSKNRLWTKGESSNHFLTLVSCHSDCDQDSLLFKVNPQGPTCHTGSRSCFQTPYNQNFIFALERVIESRFTEEKEGSYIQKLRAKGLNKIAQKVGEEGVETVIAALAETETDLINEASDLLFHLMVLLKAKNLDLNTIAQNLEHRHQK